MLTDRKRRQGTVLWLMCAGGIFIGSYQIWLVEGGGPFVVHYVSGGARIKQRTHRA